MTPYEAYLISQNMIADGTFRQGQGGTNGPSLGVNTPQGSQWEPNGGPEGRGCAKITTSAASAVQGIEWLFVASGGVEYHVRARIKGAAGDDVNFGFTSGVDGSSGVVEMTGDWEEYDRLWTPGGNRADARVVARSDWTPAAMVFRVADLVLVPSVVELDG